MNRTFLTYLLWAFSTSSLFAQHDHTGSQTETVKPPKVFLDKSPRVVEYQLKRLSNAQLLLIETKQDDAKYLPVFNAILTREGMSRAYREEALAGMMAINDSDAADEISAAMKTLKPGDASSERTAKALAEMLLSRPQAELNATQGKLIGLTESGNALLAPVGYAALIASGNAAAAWISANAQGQQVDLLNAVALIPKPDVRGGLHDEIAALLDNTDTETQAAAIRSLASVPAKQSETFRRVADFIGNDSLRTAAVKTLLSVPVEQRDAATSLQLIQWLVNFAEATPAENRTDDSFLDAMQLVDQLLAQAPTEIAKVNRERLSETVVRVVRIHTVEEEMRYDLPYFAVEAGRPVQVVLINEDLMPHNLVVTAPGALKEVAEEGLATGPNDGLDGKQYVPKSDKVLFATNMIATRTQERLTFDAPTEPGEYPYVCTFPRHWMRMYGVMVVVEDLDAWLKNPVEPKDPIGSNRQFVQSWTVDDLKDDLASGLLGRSPQIGERIFNEATCAQCHKIGDVGLGNVGPDLAETFAKFKGDDAAVLQEILDPSHRIDDKYAVHLVLDIDGQTYSGLVISEDKDKVKLLENPEAKEPTVILKDNIEQMVKTSNSMMPKGLMDRFSKDEIFELVSYIKGLQKN